MGPNPRRLPVRMLRCRVMMLSFATVISLTVCPAARPESEDAETLLGRVVESQERQQKLTREYAFRETTVTRDLDSEGRIERAKSEVALVTPGPDGEYRRLEGKDGRPLSPEEEAKEERKFQEYLKEQLRLPAEERDRKTKDKLKRRVERFQERLREAIEVYDFEPLDDEVVQDVPLRVFRFSPKPGYEGHSRSTQYPRADGGHGLDRSPPRPAREAPGPLREEPEVSRGDLRTGIRGLGGVRRRMVRWRRSLAAG